MDDGDGEYFEDQLSDDQNNMDDSFDDEYLDDEYLENQFLEDEINMDDSMDSEYPEKNGYLKENQLLDDQNMNMDDSRDNEYHDNQPFDDQNINMNDVENKYPKNIWYSMNQLLDDRNIKTDSSRYSRDQVVFKHAYRCIPFSNSKTLEHECGDKVVMPPSALDGLMDRRIEHPWLFQIKKYINPGRVSHCGVLEFTSEEGFILVPEWMMENLDLEEGETLVVESTDLPAGNYMKLQPHSTEFVQLSDPKAVLEQTLSKFSCLTAGDTIMVPYNNKKYYIDILETKPGPAICLIGTDCEADFAAPLDYKEPEETVKTKEDSPARKVEEKKIEEGPKFRAFTGRGRRMDGKFLEAKVNSCITQDDNKQPRNNGQTEKKGEVSAPTTSGHVAERPKFRAFTGMGRRSDGELVETKDTRMGNLWRPK